MRHSKNGARSNTVNPQREAALLCGGETCTLSLQGAKQQSE